MKAVTAAGRPYPPLIDWLGAEGIEYEIHEHRAAFTARSAATAEMVDPRTFAKVVVVALHDDRRIMVALDATDRVDLSKIARALGVRDARLLTESELAEVTPGCELGAIPAVGPLFDLPVYADYAVREDPEISFSAGSHRHSARVDRALWERACGVIYADLVMHDEGGPVWARS